jgi:predicted ATP-grasp superfamily ATP-dependent carboligase
MRRPAVSRCVLVTGARAPVALEVARSFAALGWRVHLADSVAATAARWSRLGVPVHRLPPPRTRFAAFVSALAELALKIGAELIVPTCEEVFYVAAAEPPVPVFAPPLATLRDLHSKHRFVALAERCGLDVPATSLVTDRSGLAALDRERIVLKPEFSRFAAATLVRPSAPAVARLAPSPDHAWVAQAFVAGEELCLWTAVHAGRVTASALYRPLLRHGRSAAYAFEAVDWPPALAIAERIAAATGMTGHLAVDLIRTPDGRAMPIECNPRAVSGVHLFAGDALARAILGEPRPSPGPGTRRHLAPAMALMGLPRALLRGELGEFAATWRDGLDAIGRPGDRLPAVGAVVDAARFAALGLTRRRSPTRQTTADIEWNGEPIA